MPEPDWKQELYAALKGELDERLRTHTELAREFLADALGSALLPHIDAAYQRGLIAGRSQTGYTTRRKRKGEEPWTDAPSAGSPSPASTTPSEGGG